MLFFVCGNILLAIGAFLLGREFGYGIGVAAYTMGLGISLLSRVPNDDESSARRKSWHE
ncbi:hypothetical protein M8A51_20500 [Schlegelella sp. S2-27]|uniref:Uncharacterized protein n=1 Tax=Caldimonas mangrovi TaxID=2944811 RepID=A0ABT0YUZ2_9BURK|nr:hypothetical protein [Caldimonas mangrovi]MCM5681916.1 hypothetical protein [Caldimonas mangrovi]